MPVVITNSEMGVYLGNAMGFGFWSLIDPVGQPAAPSFADEAQARAHVASWDANNDPEAYEYVPVPEGSGDYIFIQALKAAGLTGLLGDMEADALRYGETAGIE